MIVVVGIMRRARRSQAGELVVIFEDLPSWRVACIEVRAWRRLVVLVDKVEMGFSV